ncbi:MAG: glycoside hydrolase family 3 N-terminal domain-containing protein [Actinophytocola sp.]|uniref:glycoside hydrolase family 3 N-terminal domain-containing protein n=1 Tax=Actinophytocola sp. TaxID=1872138 RepID=UPI003D6A1863
MPKTNPLRTRFAAVLLAVTAGAALALLGAQLASDPVSGSSSAQRDEATGTTPPSEPPRQSSAPPEKADKPDKPTGKTCAAIVESLSPRQRLAQILMVGVDPTSADSATKVAGEEGIGGIFLGGNETGLLVDDKLAGVHDAAALPLAVSVDDEGGRVQRVDELDGDVPSAREMARTMSVAEVHRLARERGAALRERGVTIDFAPVVDVTTQPDEDVIGDRSFGADPAVVSKYAAAFAQGLQESGVLPVVKHFPGHGRASGDSHVATVSTPALAELRKVDLLPYQKVLRSTRAAVMVGHMSVPGLTNGVPATLSPATYRLLRGELAFDGITITDDLGGMQAVSDRYPLPKAVLASLTAGADIAFWSSGEQHVDEVLDTLEQAVSDGTLRPERVSDSLTRVLRAKGACSA